MSNNNEEVKIKKSGRPLKTDAQRQETKDRNKAKQAQDYLERNQLYREMGLDLKRGRYSSAHNTKQKEDFYQKYGIIVG
jgi:hypothetical protein